MKFGLFGGARTDPGEQASDSRIYTDDIDYICEAEQLGFHSVFLVEHHFTGFGQVSATINFLTYLAAKTSTSRLGTAVLVLPWHNPALLAEQAATLDLLSNGRFDFGIGKGYRWGEFHGFCIPMQEAEERYQETVAFLRKAWTSDGRFSHHGKYWHYDDVVIEPAPVQKPHPPFWVGAASPNSIRYAAVQGYNLLLGQGGGPETVADGVSIYRRAVEEQGRVFDPSTVGLTRALHIAMNDREREAALDLRAKFMAQVEQLSLSPTGESPTLGRPRKPLTQTERHALTERDALIGKPDEIIRRIKKLQEGGVEYIMVIDFTASLDHLRLFAREVMPAFA
ncbi:MAG TPA: LLM class flavin-dependent oxidoreductase [Stellaceae bacterium]|jgi:alkanesulfonate monooxygenase SsuD/methylene tetrahydromethanopterin reductase-like flavin-dependent oxidoreductase (luciferase family)|nr:LLM class flavin-dependent oxidoreductase [Stellaceae bacterium]